jgi:putative solute:sodium symporter small subunit
MFSKDDYWGANIRLILICLSIWFVVAYLLSIVFVAELNQITMGGYKLGFWFAQQGSIYVFLGLVFYYAHQMNKIDDKFNSK